MPPIIENFWPRVLGSVMWFFGTFAWGIAVIVFVGWVLIKIIR
jgi:hypothetical protein